jgi:hypothetical protein
MEVEVEAGVVIGPLDTFPFTITILQDIFMPPNNLCLGIQVISCRDLLTNS